MMATRTRGLFPSVACLFGWLAGMLAGLLAGMLSSLEGSAWADDASQAISAIVEHVNEPVLTDSDREHWSFQPLRATVPPVAPNFLGTMVPKQAKDSRAISESAIDDFVLTRLRELDLNFAEAASPQQWLRRVTLDLTGLPPAPDALERFLERSGQPDAMECEVDRLLASPAHGEHAAQAWLDLARFAETDGFEHDKVRPEAWRYRDWVVTAINEDMPYDRFMLLQVAGDILDPSHAIATHFCVAGPDMPDLNDQVERRHNLLNEMTATVGSVFLGLQMGCAACHDHKYDPVSQADFYRLRGILASGVSKLERDKPWMKLVEQERLELPRFYNRGDHRQPTSTLRFGVPRIVASPQFLTSVAASSQPRVEMAQWLSSPDNPLPARTMANRMWQSHFGRGLAPTPGDLGVVGIEPSHPELLDWLASRLISNLWSTKRLRRTIVLSRTYRQASYSLLEIDDFARRRQLDPECRDLSRYPRRRLTGEQLRDCMLASTHALDRRALGPSVMPPLPAQLVSTLLPGQWKNSPETADHHRRSLYIFARRNLRYPIFESFDRPDAGISCPKRDSSVTATQALLLFNSDFSLGLAKRLAAQARWLPQQEQPTFLWNSVLARSPTDSELQHWESLNSQFDDREQALVAASLALLNSSEYVYVD